MIVSVACAAATAGPILVSPDEAAALSPVAEASFGADDIPCDSFPHSFVPSDSTTTASRSDLSTDENDDTLIEDSENEQRFGSTEPSTLFTDELPPVVRSQSPEIELLPLAGGETPVENTSLLSWATGTRGRIRGDYLTDFDETDRIGVQTLTQSWLGFGFDAEVNYWQRPVMGLGREPLWTGDLNLIYNVMPHPRFKFRSGAGAAWTLEDGKPHAGYNITHGLDVYLLWRAMVTGEIDWGKLDDDDLFRYRIALGLTVKSAEFFTGYESYKLGDERLDGWVNGVAWWY